MGQLVDDLLHFTQLGQGELQLQPVNLAPLVEAGVDIFHCSTFSLMLARLC